MVADGQEDLISQSIAKDKHKSDGFGSVLGEEKLWVKLEFPKDGEEEEEVMDIEDQNSNGFQHKDEVNSNINDKQRICHICDKAFRSGKALGGHMRIHVQKANKRDLFSKNKLKAQQSIKFKRKNPRQEFDFVEKKCYKKTTTTTNYYVGSDNIMEIPLCSVCGKNFQSMNSLFGHMRCHPERYWRGIRPPPSIEKNSSDSSLSDAEPLPQAKIDDQIEFSSDSDKNGAVDLTESLRGSWIVTARRGRKATETASSSRLLDLNDDQMHEAATGLMMLALGDLFRSGPTHRQKGDESLAANTICEANVLFCHLVSSEKPKNIDHQPNSVGSTTHSPTQIGNEERGFVKDEKYFVGSKQNLEESAIKMEGKDLLEEKKHNGCSDDVQLDIKNKEQQDIDFESTSIKMLIKNKKKRKKVKLCDLELAQNASLMTPVHEEPVAVIATKPPYDKYRCSTCDKSFSSHQALGGHMSSHNKFIKNFIGDSDINLIDPTVQVEEIKGNGSNLVQGTQNQCMVPDKKLSTTQALGEAVHTCRRLLELDLNEKPASEDEAGFESELCSS